MSALKALGLLVAGALVGLASVALHLWWWGLVLAAVATLLSGWALRPGWLTRLPYAAGWVIVCAEAMIPRGSGSYAIAGDLRGYLLIAVGLVLIVVTTATLPLGRAPRTDPASDSE